jgi:hypothetical protein
VAPPRSARLRVGGVALAGLLLLAVLAAFLVLHLRMPAGWSPVVGRAPRIGAPFEAVFPYPQWSLSAAGFRRASMALILAMWALYAGAAFVISRAADPGERRRLLLVVSGLCLAMHVVLVLLPPVLSTDLFFYALSGKMTLTGLNPYVTPGSALAPDPLFPYASWQHLRSHYGPAFLWIAAGATWLGGGGPLGTALAFKTLAAVCNLASCWAIHQLGRGEDRDGLDVLALYAWNPLVLIESAGSAHSEAIMLSLALVGAVLLRRGRLKTGWVLLVLSAATKYISGVLGLLMAVRTVARAEPGHRLSTGARLAAVGGLALVLLYLPFWRGLGVFGPALDIVFKGRALQAGVAPVAADQPIVALAIFAVLLGAALVIAARSAVDRTFELSAALATYFVLFVLWWRMPWYFVTGLTLALPATSTRTSRALMLVTMFLGLLAMLLYGVLAPDTRS